MFGSGPISFPGLGIPEMTISRVALSLFGLDVYWYGLLITAGFVFGILLASALSRKAGLGSDIMIDYAIVLIPSSIVGARLYYVFFSGMKITSLMDIVDTRKGGMAIYGGIIAGIIAAFILTRVKKISLFAIADCAAPGLMVGQAIGRWGNFINQEAYGTETKLPWRMRIYVGGRATEVHPTFLYESLWNLFGIIVLAKVFEKRKFRGEVTAAYCAWYGLGRMIIEGLRIDSLMLGSTGIRVSQALSGLILIAGVVVVITGRMRVRNPRFAAESLSLSPDSLETKANGAESQPPEYRDSASAPDSNRNGEVASNEPEPYPTGDGEEPRDKDDPLEDIGEGITADSAESEGGNITDDLSVEPNSPDDTGDNSHTERNRTGQTEE